MAIHLLPFLLAKVAGKLAVKKAAVHHGHHSLARKAVKEGAKQAANRAVEEGLKRDDRDKGK
jgi:hypothetical protein